MDTIKIVKEKRMTTHALVNVTSMLTMIEENRVSDLQDLLLSLHTAQAREMTLSEQEVLFTLSRCLESTAKQKDDLNDKLTHIFWKAGGLALLNADVL